MSEKTGDILDEIRQIDKAVKAKMLIEKITHLKKLARQINELREETNVSLEEMGLSKADAKRIVDYINEQSGVKLTDSDKQAIRERVVKNLEKSRDVIVDEVKDVEVDKFIELINSQKLGHWAGASITTLPYNYTGGTHTGGLSPLWVRFPSYTHVDNSIRIITFICYTICIQDNK